MTVTQLLARLENVSRPTLANDLKRLQQEGKVAQRRPYSPYWRKT